MRKSKIEILPSDNGKDYFFHIKSGNGKIQGDGELYPTPSAAERGAQQFQESVARAVITISPRCYKEGNKRKK